VIQGAWKIKVPLTPTELNPIEFPSVKETLDREKMKTLSGLKSAVIQSNLAKEEKRKLRKERKAKAKEEAKSEKIKEAKAKVKEAKVEKAEPQSMYKTLMCDSVIKKFKCKYEDKCNKAHTIDELNPIKCSFAEKCTKHGCGYYHPHKETKEMWLMRYITAPPQVKISKPKPAPAKAKKMKSNDGWNIV